MGKIMSKKLRTTQNTSLEATKMLSHSNMLNGCFRSNSEKPSFAPKTTFRLKWAFFLAEYLTSKGETLKMKYL